jgi:hypothetical protein
MKKRIAQITFWKMNMQKKKITQAEIEEEWRKIKICFQRQERDEMNDCGELWGDIRHDEKQEQQ